MSGGVGAFVGYAFGRHEGVEWGFELFGISHFTKSICSNRPRMGVGPLLQFAMVGMNLPRLTLALHGGRDVGKFSSVTGELGGTLRWGSDPGYGLHMGVTPQWTFFNASLRAQLFLDDYSAVAGLRFPPTYGWPESCVAIPGRPLRAETGIVTVSERGQGEPDVSGPASATTRDERAGRVWERDAQQECASVPAFLQLARDLMAHGAPPELVHRALDAACDEMHHALSCAAMASTLLGVAVRPTMPEFEPRPVPSMTDLAVESWLDGCINEGAAAEQAAREARLARDPRVRAVKSKIAVDERRHAELAWDVVRWAVTRGGRATRSAVEVLIH